MTDNEARALHMGIIQLEEMAEQCLPASRGLYVALAIVHTAMHLGEAGLVSLVEYQNRWIREVGQGLADQMAVDAARAAMGQPPAPDQPINPTGVYDHFATVEKLAEALRNGNFPSNPNTHNPQ